MSDQSLDTMNRTEFDPPIEELDSVEIDDKSQEIIHTKIVRHSSRALKPFLYERYVQKIADSLSCCLCNQSISQIGRLIHYTFQIFIKKSAEFMMFHHRRTLSIDDSISITKMMLTGDLREKCIAMGNHHVDAYIKQKTNGERYKRELLLSPFAVERIVKMSGHSFFLGHSTGIFIASVIETLVKHLFSTACSDHLTTQKLNEAVKTDPDLSQYFRTYSFHFYDTAFVQTLELADRPSHIFHKAQMENFVKGLLRPLGVFRFQKEWSNVLRNWLEQWLAMVMRQANCITIASGRRRLMSSDIEIVVAIQENRLPS